MKTSYAIAAVAMAMIAPAVAQTTMPPTATTPSAVTVPSTSPTVVDKADPGAPLPGANSFTEAQARSRVEQLGYTNVTGLAKDADGIWRGKATKEGQTTDVSVDFRGNIVVGQK